MLFMIGLEIDLKKIVRAGRVILFAAGGQLVGACLLGIAFFWASGSMGGGGFDALYLSIACALVQHRHHRQGALREARARHAAGTHHARRAGAAGHLCHPVSGGAAEPCQPAGQRILLSVGRVGVLVATALVLSRYVLPRLFHQIARRPELILLGALAWCFLIGEIAEKLHLSREMGALIAGVSLSTFPYALDVTAKVTSLRDFFVTLFFVALGMTIPLPTCR